MTAVAQEAIIKFCNWKTLVIFILLTALGKWTFMIICRHTVTVTQTHTHTHTHTQKHTLHKAHGRFNRHTNKSSNDNEFQEVCFF